MTDAAKAVYVERDVVVASGPDALTFLHAMCSQDVTSMTVGETRWAFLLTPQGKVVSHFRVFRMHAEELRLDTEVGFGEALRSSLARYLIRTKCVLSPVETIVVARTDEEQSGSVPAHPILGGFETPVEGRATDDADRSESERGRINAGMPAMGAELDDDAVPNGTGLLRWAVNFGKGCYLGQELVERIDSRGGNVAKRLCRVRSTDASQLFHEGDFGTVRVTSTVAGDQGTIGLAWVARSIAVGETVQLGEGQGDVAIVSEVGADLEAHGE